MTLPQHRARPGAEAIRPADAEKAELIGPGIWMSPGLSNSYLVTTDAERVIVNAGTPFEALVHRQLFDAVDSSPTRYIIVTQGHPDHVGGIDTFRDPVTDVVAQANWWIWRDDFARLLEYRKGKADFAWGEPMFTGMRQIAARFGSPLPEPADPTPSVTVQDRCTLEVGGRRFELIATAGGETTDSLVVWMPDERVCFCGNLFGPLFGHVPNLVTMRGDRYRDALTYVDSLEVVRSLHAETLITGHFEPVRGAEVIDDELRRMGEAMCHVHDETVRFMNEDRDVHDAMRDIGVPPALDVGEGYGKTSWNVRAIWEHYTGWFHHRSTTELYHVPFASVRRDLVSLAGAAAIGVRAREHLDAGEPIEAIHLAELVDDRVVLAAAHRVLLADATNFWERAWLHRQIERYDG